jgi:hypothetical protein
VCAACDLIDHVTERVSLTPFKVGLQNFTHAALGSKVVETEALVGDHKKVQAVISQRPGCRLQMTDQVGLVFHRVATEDHVKASSGDGLQAVQIVDMIRATRGVEPGFVRPALQFRGVEDVQILDVFATELRVGERAYFQDRAVCLSEGKKTFSGGRSRTDPSLGPTMHLVVSQEISIAEIRQIRIEPQRIRDDLCR